MYMASKYKDNVILDPEEVYRINRIAIAKYYGITPQEVDDMPQSDVDDTLQVMWAENALAQRKS